MSGLVRLVSAPVPEICIPASTSDTDKIQPEHKFFFYKTKSRTVLTADTDMVNDSIHGRKTPGTRPTDCSTL